jgi:hypothetical protein
MKHHIYNAKQDISEEVRFDDQEQIDLILEEANAYGLRQEVIYTANRFMNADPKLNKLDAYFMSYSEWIK